MPRLKPENVRNKRAAIIAAARRLRETTGPLSGVTMKVLCANIGMSPGSFYCYFRSKKELEDALQNGDRRCYDEPPQKLSPKSRSLRRVIKRGNPVWIEGKLIDPEFDEF